mgnify:CR=1 FL=1
MIRIDFLTPPDGRLLGFRMEGHAGLGEKGQDILCAAVSSAAYLVANTATEVLHLCPLSLRVGEGEMFFRVEEKDEAAWPPAAAGAQAPPHRIGGTVSRPHEGWLSGSLTNIRKGRQHLC